MPQRVRRPPVATPHLRRQHGWAWKGRGEPRQLEPGWQGLPWQRWAPVAVALPLRLAVPRPGRGHSPRSARGTPWVRGAETLRCGRHRHPWLLETPRPRARSTPEHPCQAPMVHPSLANRFTHCDSIRDLDRNRITIGRIDSNRFEVVIHSDFVVNQNLYHHALTLGA